MRKQRVGGGLVLITRHGERWRADVFMRQEGGARHAAEVVGSLGCIREVAEKAPPIFDQPNGEELFVEFLGANRCRLLGPAGARPPPLSAEDPTDADVEAARNAHELNR